VIGGRKMGNWEKVTKNIIAKIPQFQDSFNYIYHNGKSYVGVFPNGREFVITDKLEPLITFQSFIYTQPAPNDELYNIAGDIWLNPKKLILLELINVKSDYGETIDVYKVIFENGQELHVQATKQMRMFLFNYYYDEDVGC